MMLSVLLPEPYAEPVIIRGAYLRFSYTYVAFCDVHGMQREQVSKDNYVSCESGTGMIMKDQRLCDVS